MLKPFATKLDEKTIETLDNIAKKTQIPKARLCRKAIELLATHYEEVEESFQLGEEMRRKEKQTVAGPTS